MSPTVLTRSEEEHIATACSHLIAHRFIAGASVEKIRDSYLKGPNPLFSYTQRNFGEIERRLESVGYELISDIPGKWIGAQPIMEIGVNDTGLSADESRILIALAILFERNEGDLGFCDTYDATVQDVVSLLTTEYRVLDKPPTGQTLGQALSRFERCSLVVKHMGSWADLTTEFTILPSIRAISSGEVIRAFHECYEHAPSVENTNGGNAEQPSVPDSHSEAFEHDGGNDDARPR